VTRWQLVCAAELVLIGLAWWMLGGDPAPAAPESGGATHAAPAATAAQPLSAPSSLNRSPEELKPAEAAASRTHTSAPAASSSLVSFVGLVQDEAGAPVRMPQITIRRAGEAIEYYSCNPEENHFLLADRRPGALDLEISANGFVSWQGTVALAEQPSIQRHNFALRRAWRVVVQVRTKDGSDFIARMSERLGVPSFRMRLHVSVDRERQPSDLPARSWMRGKNEFAEFISSQIIDPTVPKNCAGVLDLAVDPPLIASAWLGRHYLGSAPIEAGASEIVIVADEEALVARLASVVVRVVDTETGEPIPGARVKVSPTWTSGGATQTTDAAGRAQLSNLVPQIYDLDVSCDGYASTFRELILEPGAMLDFGDVRIGRPGEILGIVLDPDGKPVPNLRFSVFPTGAWTRPESARRYSSRTDSEGRIRDPAGPERYQIIVSSPEFSLQAEDWPRGSAESEVRTIRLQRGAEVLLSFTGEHRDRRSVWLLDSAGRLLFSSAVPASYSPWPLKLAGGSYLLSVEDEQRNHVATVDLRVPDGGGPVSVEIP